MVLYYGLTEEEAKRKEMYYPPCMGFTHKGVCTTLQGLRKLVKDNDMVNIVTKYVRVDSSYFEIDHDVILDKKYGLIAVKIPFKFPIVRARQLFREVNDEDK